MVLVSNTEVQERRRRVENVASLISPRNGVFDEADEAAELSGYIIRKTWRFPVCGARMPTPQSNPRDGQMNIRWGHVAKRAIDRVRLEASVPSVDRVIQECCEFRFALIAEG